MQHPAEERLSIPAASILVLLITLVVVTPLAIWRMAQQLASPVVEVISLESSPQRFNGHWKVGEVEFFIEEGAGEAASIGTFALSVILPPLAEDSGDRMAPSGTVRLTSTRPRDGSIEQVIFLDPDGDGISSATICIRSAGSGSSLQLKQYTLSIHGINSEGTWSDLTRIPEHLKVGYMGHDTIERESEMLVRTFPIYREGDRNETPTGGTRSLIWDFHNGRWRPDPRK